MSQGEWLLAWVMLETGLRVGDAVALRRSALKADGIHYRAQKTNKPGVASVSEALREALRGAPGYIFPGRKPGTHLTRQAAWKRIKKACERAGVDPFGVSPHAFRKVFAVETYRSEGMEATRQALQHSARDTTEIYAFADWATGENADKPLTRRDLRLIVGMVIKALPTARTQSGGCQGGDAEYTTLTASTANNQKRGKV